jgi:hypothetical protein
LFKIGVKKSLFTFGLLASSLVMLVLVPFLNNNSFLSNPSLAQEYDKYGDSSYSQIPTDDKKYECRTGPFEGFFVSSVEFCKFKFDKDDRKDNRDNRTAPAGSVNNNSTLVNTFNCINPNVININTETNQSSSLLSGLQPLQGSAAQNLIGNISGLSQIDLNKTIINLCIINDNDKIVIQGGGNGTAVDPCEECFELLTQEQLDNFAGNLLGLPPGSPEAVEAICNFLLEAENGILENGIRTLLDFDVSTTVQDTLIACLEDAGVVFV